ncbi:hypothetical protein FACS1894187_05320 [Synergistales bacterium]|nr:hypothetical protein FACS1894187_05320 [Synergistales bacterium]
MSLTSERIKEMRKNKGLSQAKLALEVGVKANTVWRWENDKALPTESISFLADFFDTSTDYIAGRTNDPAVGSNVSKNLQATALDHSIANINGTINSSEQTIVFEYGEGKNKMRLIFPHETSGEVIAQAINAALMK